jgi:hypothetical protein
MTRRAYYGIVLAALIGMIAGLLELGWQLVADQDLG